MREYGQIQSSYWTHPDIQSLSIEAKIIGAYLLTCQHTNGIGCFRMPMGYVSIDLGMGIETVSKGFRELYRNGFLVADFDKEKHSEYVLIPSFLRWNPVQNPNAAKARVKEFETVPSSISIYPKLINALRKHGKYWSEDFLNHLETLSKGFQNRSDRVPEDVPDNKTQPDPTKTQPDPDIMSGKNETAILILETLNATVGSKFKPTKSNLTLVNARLKEGITETELIRVIRKKHAEWGGDPQMRQYLRPATLFNREKCSQYVGQLGIESEAERRARECEEFVNDPMGWGLSGEQNVIESTAVRVD